MQVIAELKFDKIREIGIGQGLNSTVYLAHDPQLNTNFAVKQIDKTTFWNPDCFSEAKAVHAVAHPNVVSVQYGCENGNFAFIAMPFYKNGSLADRLVSRPLSLSEFSRSGQDILQGLAHIHMRGYLHLDLKPSNILLGDNLKPLVADFGQARNVGPGGLITAPPLYYKTFPPEVLKTNKAVIQSDIYLSGVLFYRALNGEDHFNEQLLKYPTDAELEIAISRGKFPDRTSFLPHVPKKLRTLLRKTLKIEPTERFDSATSVADALGRISFLTDWSVSIMPSGEINWIGNSLGKAPVMVELKKTIKGWCVEVHTQGGSLRAKGRADFWKVSTMRKEALAHLTYVFEQL